MINRRVGRQFVRVTANLFGIVFIATLAQGQVVREVKDISVEDFTSVAIDHAGSVIYSVSTSNQYGTNPEHRPQIFRWDPASGAGAQLTMMVQGCPLPVGPLLVDGFWFCVQ